MGQASSSSLSSQSAAPAISQAEKGPGAGGGGGLGLSSSSSRRDMMILQPVPAVEQDLTVFLSDECLSCIFQKLPVKDRNACSLVCKRWHYVESKARDRLTLRAEETLEGDAVCLMNRFEFIVCLSLKCGRKETSIGDKSLMLIGQHCKLLTRLKLKGCKAITDDGIGQFAKVRGSLKRFSCGSCGFGSRGLNLLLQNSPNLEDLSIKRLRKLRENPAPVLAGKSRLQRLCLKEITSGHLFGTLIVGSKHIRTLVLARSPGLWDQFFELISEHLSELVELHVETLNMGDVALRAIARCLKLEVLHVAKAFDCSDLGYRSIASGCRKLRKLHIDDRRTGRVGDEALLAIGKNCTELQELVLIGVNVTAKSLALIALNCTGLERMALCNSDAVGDRELSCIAEKCLALKKLCIKNCPISDLGLKKFARGCPSLSKVKVKKCKDITWASATWLQMYRASLVISLDSPALAQEEEIQEEGPQGGDARVVRASTALFCNRTPLIKNRLVLAATSFLRGVPKPS